VIHIPQHRDLSAWEAFVLKVEWNDLRKELGMGPVYVSEEKVCGSVHILREAVRAEREKPVVGLAS
jgi:hypothetical protein